MESLDSFECFSSGYYPSFLLPLCSPSGTIYHEFDESFTLSEPKTQQARLLDSIDPTLLCVTQISPSLPPVPVEPALCFEPLESEMHVHRPRGDFIGETHGISKKRLTMLRRQGISPAMDDRRLLPTVVPQDISQSYEQIQDLLSRTVIPSSAHSTLFRPFISLENGERNCRLCGYTQVNHTQMVQHLREHFRVYPFACTIFGCPFTSTRRADVKKHVNEQHGTGEGFQCPVWHIRHERNLKRHIRTKHD